MRLLREVMFALALGCGASSNSGGSHPPDGGARDSSSGDAADAKPSGCHTVSGSGDLEKCIYYPDPECASMSGAASGSCPSAKLYGCCLHDPDGGPTSAVCYYGASAASKAAEDLCAQNGYQGLPYQWLPTAP